jgi:hypothetical protein
MKCDKCNGVGYQKDEYPVTIKGPTGTKYIQGYSRTCLKCHGKGEVDWIEAVVGKKIEDLNHDELLEFSRLR